MISGLKLRNWRSHEQTAMHFRKGSHLILGPMGSGKTSIFDALCFALFGTWPALKSRRVGLEETILARPSPAQAARVELELQRDGKTFTIERIVTGKGSEAFLREGGRMIDGPQPIRTNESIHRLLKTDYETFVRTVYAEQNRLDYFLNLQPRERKRQIDELLGIDRFETARGTATQALNKLKAQRAEIESFLQGAGLQDLQTGVERLQTEVNDAKNKAEAAQNAASKAKNERDEIAKKVGELERKERQALEAEKRIAVLEQTINSLEAQLAELPAIESNEIESRQSEARAKREHLLAIQRELQNDRAEIKTLERHVREVEKELQNASSEEAAQKALEETAQALGKARENRDKMQSSIAQAQARITELTAAVDALEKEIAECPVCDSPLSADKHARLRQNKKQKLEEERKTAETYGKNLDEREKQLEKVSKEHLNAQNNMAIAKQAERERKRLQESKQKLQNLQEKVKNTQAGFEEKDIEKVEAELRELEKAAHAPALSSKRDKASEELEQARNSTEKLASNAAELQSARDSLRESERKAAGAEAEARHSQELQTQKAREHGNARERLLAVQKRAAEAQRIDTKSELLQRFQSLLEETQVELRNELVDAVNEALATVFPAVYPYGDFNAVRLEAGEEDYAIQLRSREGTWAAIEGASGGEKSCAALALRIAFASILSPGLSLLVLDEPTHNLDERAVQLLSAAMRDELPKLVEQIFIITHDEKLKESASATVFRVERDKERGERSIVESLDVIGPD